MQQFSRSTPWTWKTFLATNDRQKHSSVNSPAPPNGIEQDDLPLFGTAREPLVFLGILEQTIL
jgi:hypothetical protein